MKLVTKMQTPWAAINLEPGSINTKMAEKNRVRVTGSTNVKLNYKLQNKTEGSNKCNLQFKQG